MLSTTVFKSTVSGQILSQISENSRSLQTTSISFSDSVLREGQFWFIYIITCSIDYRPGFGLNIGFMDCLYTRLTTTGNYSATANLYNSQITTTLAPVFFKITPRHRRSRKSCVQEYLYCCVSILCCSNVFTEPLPRNFSVISPISRSSHSNGSTPMHSTWLGWDPWNHGL
jgi:hypothetical protein